MRLSTSAIVLVAAMGIGLAASAQNLVQNGSFNSTTGGQGGYGQFVPNQSLIHGNGGGTAAYGLEVTDWNTIQNSANNYAPFLFVVDPTTLDTAGFPDDWDSSHPQLWGTNNGGNDAILAPPSGGPNALLLDADYDISPIYQAISGLTVGDKYTISFEWAAGQWQGRYGPTTEGLEIGLGGHVQEVAPINGLTGVNALSLPSEDFSGWMSYSATFVYNGQATSMGYARDETTQYFQAAANWLTFIAEGSPSGLPPTVLLTDVSLVQAASNTPISANYGVPEPTSWVLMIGGLGGIGAILRRRARHRTAQTA